MIEDRQDQEEYDEGIDSDRADIFKVRNESQGGGKRENGTMIPMKHHQQIKTHKTMKSMYRKNSLVIVV